MGFPRPLSFFQLAFGLIGAIFCLLGSARAADLEIQRQQGSQKIPMLEFSTEDSSVVFSRRVSPATGLALKIIGIWRPRNEDSLLVQSLQRKVIPNPKTGRFVLWLPLTQEVQRETLISVAADGNAQQERIEIRVKDLERWRELAAPHRGRRTQASLGGGLSFIHYSDPRVSDYSETAFTLKGSYLYQITPRNWDAQASVYLTLLPLSKNSDVSVRFFGLNGRIGYKLTPIISRWKITLYGGLYYLTMSVSGDRFGYQNMLGPQLYPTLQYTFAGGRTFGAYLKASPVNPTLTQVSFGSHELAAGVSYFWSANGHSVGPTLDLASQHILINGRAFDSSSLSLGFSYGL